MQEECMDRVEVVCVTMGQKDLSIAEKMHIAECIAGFLINVKNLWVTLKKDCNSFDDRLI